MFHGFFRSLQLLPTANRGAATAWPQEHHKIAGGLAAAARPPVWLWAIAALWLAMMAVSLVVFRPDGALLSLCRSVVGAQ